jgi:hypothetical protein
MSESNNQIAVPEPDTLKSDANKRVLVEPDPADLPSPGPNLALLYSLIAFALAAAIGLAMLIVLPFYRRR